jgi:hypothetical protein
VLRVDNRPTSVVLGTDPLPSKKAAQDTETTGWTYDKESRTVWIQVDDRTDELLFRIEK